MDQQFGLKNEKKSEKGHTSQISSEQLSRRKCLKLFWVSDFTSTSQRELNAKTFTVWTACVISIDDLF